MVVVVLLMALAASSIGFAASLLAQASRRHALRPDAEAIALGAVTNFFDTLGIGSFAPTTAYFKMRRLVTDASIPATLNVGHALPTVAQALIFIHLVRVDPRLLLGCIVAAVIGATLGASWVVRLPLRVVQAIVGVALLIAAALYALSNLHWLPAGGNALSLGGASFAIAVGAHLLLGALMTFGIGLYAPSLILLCLLGLDPIAAFPVMMGACAFLMPAGGLRFVRSERVDLRVALGLSLGGIPAVLLAAYVVRSLPLTTLRWGVVAVVLYAAMLMLRAASAPPAQRPEVDVAASSAPKRPQ